MLNASGPVAARILSATSVGRLRPVAMPRHKRRVLAIVPAVVLLALMLASPVQASLNDTIFVSRADGLAGAPGDAASRLAPRGQKTISADGRYVVFESSADNLEPLAPDDPVNVFVRDLVSGTTELVSRATGATGAPAEGFSAAASISASGRYVVFQSSANNLSTDDAKGSPDIFVRDLETDTTTLASRTNGLTGAGATGFNFGATISGDGRYVAFISDAGDLSTEDNNGFDVFVRDLVGGTTTFVSRADGAAGAAQNEATPFASAAWISTDGRHVAFLSTANNLSLDDNDALTNLFVRDLDTGTTTYVNRADGPTGAAADAGPGPEVAISGDGRYVVFSSVAANLVPGDTNATSDVFVRDLVAGTTTLVSRADGPAGALGSGASDQPSISADGRFVTFRSDSDELSTEDNNATHNVFLRDLQTGATTYVSRASGAGGAPADRASGLASISDDGRFVAFHSDATNLSAEDGEETDVFVRDLGFSLGVEIEGAGPGQGTVTSSPAGIACGADCVERFGAGQAVVLTAASAPGWNFMGFAGGGCSGTATTCTVTLDQARSVTATFAAVPRALSLTKAGGGSGTVTSQPGGIDCGSDCAQDYVHGTDVTLTADATGGSTFTGFTGGGCSGAATTCTVTMDQARSVTATFAVVPRGLSVTKAGAGSGTVTSQPAGIDCGSDCSQEFDHGTQVTLTANPSAGASFTGFTGGGCSGSGTTCTVTMDQARSVTGTFALVPRAVTVTKAGTGSGRVTSSPAGIDCGADCEQDYDHGTEVTLTANPAAGSTFTGFTGAGCSGTGATCTVTMDQTRSVTATFARTPVNQPPPQGGRTINGTAGPDVLTGTPFNDVINCGAGDDVVSGGGGNDVINCGAGNDRIDAGAGDDRVDGGSGNDLVQGGLGVDRLVGNTGNDFLGGGEGNDLITGGEGADRASGNEGADVISGGADNDSVSGNEGNDRINGNEGDDRVAGNSGADRLAGGSGRDRIGGGSGNDRLSGNAGGDRLSGNSGRDSLAGGSGNDSLFGNSGNDRLSGNSGRDRLVGGTGRDRLNGGTGRDREQQ